MPLLSTISLLKSVSALVDLDTMRQFKPKIAREITRLSDDDMSQMSANTHKLLREAKDSICKMKEASLSGSHTFDIPLPKPLQGNRSVWEVAKVIIENIKSRQLPSKELREIKESAGVALRVSNETSNGTFPGTRMMLQHGEEHHAVAWYCFYQSWAKAIGKLAYAASLQTKDKTPISQRKSPYLIGEIGIIRFDNCYIVETNRTSYLMLNVHLERLEQLLGNLATLTICAAYSSYRFSPAASIHSIFNAFYKNAMKNPEACGEYAKAARTLLIAKLDTSNIFTKPLWQMVADDFPPEKLSGAEVIRDALEDAFIADVDRLIFSNVYKITPHPDANLKRAFEKIRGITSPNYVDPKDIPVFAGALKRAIILSMLDMGHQVRCAEGAGDAALMEMINASSVNKAELSRTDPLRFADLNMLPILRFTDFKNTHVPISDKSSAPNLVLTPSQLKNIEETMAGHVFRGGSTEAPNIRPINDVLSVLKGDSKLNLSNSIMRFEQVIRMHEAFESRFPGVEIEDIPHDQFVEFLKSNPELTYLVLTEPKLGELHKEVTRIFYMGEQELKILTQAVERLAKQISKRQAGVSIVKTYSARRRDLEQFADRMRATYSGTKSLFLSFDMTSFSMKFPMPLLREFGKILASITGEKWMRRIDLFFRNSIIVHNTRGYFDYIHGVKGGFEGFLNFIWSSIHATVMEIALHEVGLQGTLLAYSDDGLLHITLPADCTKEEIRELIMRIKAVYLRFGLEFHLGKTLVSCNVWEYLGDICYEGRLLPQWVKEACAFGKVELTKGFNSTYSKISQVQAQAGALALAGFNAQAAHYLGVLETIEHIRRMMPLTNSKTLFWLLILPLRCGGFRMPSPFMLSTSTTLEGDSDFIADMHMLTSTRPSEVQMIMEHILENPPTVMIATSALLEGRRISSSIEPVNGSLANSYVINEIEKRAEGKHKLVDHPLPESLAREIIHYMSKFSNVNIQAISELIKSTPNWKEYSDTLSLVRSRSTQTLVGIDVIKKAERKDRICIVKAISRLQKALNRHPSMRHDPLDFHNILLKKVLPQLHLTPLRPQFRVIADQNLDNPDIIINIDISSQTKLVVADIPYVEPTNLARARIENLSWMAEYTSSRIEDLVRKYSRVAASALTASPEAAELIVAISRLFGIEVPALAQNISNSLNRIRSHTGERPDMSVHYFGLFKSRSRIDLSLRMRQIYETRESVDRTTYIESARWYAAHAAIEAGVLRQRPTDKGLEYKFTLKTLAMLQVPPARKLQPFTLPPKPVYSSATVEREFEGALLEAEKAVYDSMIVREHISPAFDVDNRQAVLQSTVIFELFSEDISSWLYAILFKDPNTGIQSTLTLPTSYFAHQEIVSDALRKCLMNYIEQNYTMRSALYDWARSSNLDRLNQFPLTVMEGIRTFIEILTSALAYIPSSLADHAIIDHALIPTEDLRKWFITRIYSKTMLTKIVTPFVAIEHTHSRTRDATASRINVVSRSVSASISMLYAIGRDCNWDKRKMTKVFTDKDLNIPNNDVDWMLDMLSAVSSKLRDSKHRSVEHPYNEKALAIELVKMKHAIDTIVANPSPTGEDPSTLMAEYSMPRDLRLRVMKYMKVTAENVDLMRFLASPIPSEISNRACIWIKMKKHNRFTLTPWDRCHSVEELIDEVKRSSSAFHMSFVRAIVNNINPYHTATRTFLTDEIEHLSRPSIKIIPYTGTRSVFRGMDTSTMSDEEAVLAGSHVAILLAKLGFNQCSYDHSVDNRVVAFLSANKRLTQASGKTVGLTQMKWSTKNVTLVNMAMENTNEAACALLHMYSNARCSLTMYYDEKEDVARIIGCAYSNKKPATMDRHAALHPKIDIADVHMLTTASISSLISSFHNSHVLHRVGHEFQAPIRSIIQQVNVEAIGHARSVKSTPFVTHSSPLLAAASIMRRGVTNSSNVIRSYICMLAHVHGVTLDRLRQFAIATLSAITTINQSAFGRHGLATDIRSCNTWLMMRNVAASIDVQFECSEIMRIMQSVIPRFKVGLTLNIPGNPRSASEIELKFGHQSRLTISSDTTAWLLETTLFEGMVSERLAARLGAAIEEDDEDFELEHALLGIEDEDIDELADLYTAPDAQLSPVTSPRSLSDNLIRGGVLSGVDSIAQVATSSATSSADPLTINLMAILGERGKMTEEELIAERESFFEGF